MKELIKQAMSKPDKIPPGWKTSGQWAKKLGYSESHMSLLLKRLLVLGKIQVKKFHVKAYDRVMPTPHYKER